jgi:hypothetical protein
MVDAERNRPEDVPSTAQDPLRAAVLGAIEANSEHMAMDTAEIGRLVIEAIKERRFFVVVRPEMTVDALQQRIAWVQGAPGPEPLRF